MTKWEYAIVRWDSTREHWWAEPSRATSSSLFEIFTDLGEHGWELCIVHPAHHWLVGGPHGWGTDHATAAFFFKRPAG